MWLCNNMQLINLHHTVHSMQMVQQAFAGHNTNYL